MYYPLLRYKYLIIEYNSTWNPKPIKYIYTYSFEDVRVYLNKQSFQEYKEYDNEFSCYEIQNRLAKTIKKYFKIYEITSNGYIQIPIILALFIDENFSFEIESVPGKSKAYYPIKELQQISSPNYKIPKYSYPIKTILVIRKNTYQGRKHFSYSITFENDWWSNLTFRTRAANTDPELQTYLCPRDKQIYTNYKHDQKHNQHNIGNNWKRHTHNRKQWSKRIDNPSYTKLSREMWKYELGQKNKNANQRDEYISFYI